MNRQRTATLLALIATPLALGFQDRTPQPDLDRPGFESPPAPPPAQVADCSCDERPGPEHVYLHSGEFHHSVEDLRIPGRGFDFVWARKYRSRLGPDTAMGSHWDFSYNLSVRQSGNDVLVQDGNTRVDRYRRKASNVFVAAELFREGRFRADGRFELIFPDLSTWTFRDLSGPQAPGMIQAIVDRHGNTMSFSYDALGRLSSIRDTLGRDVTLTYGTDGMLDAITDFAGRRWSYRHDTAGDLLSATSPAVTGTPNGNDFPAGKTTTYSYSMGFADERLNHNLLTITDPKGQTFLRNSYSPAMDSSDPDFDRLIQQVRGMPDEVESYWLDDGVTTAKQAGHGSGRGRRVIVNDRMGHVSEFDLDGFDRCVQVRQYTGRAKRTERTTSTDNRPLGKLRSSDPDWFETRFEYNPDGRRIQTTHPNGNITRRLFEGDLDPSAPARTRANLRELHRLPGTHLPVGDQASLSEFFQWQPGFGACCGEEFVTQHMDARGNTTIHTFDATGNRVQTTHRLPSIVESFEYNSFGQLTAHTHPDHGAGVLRRDEYRYYGVGAVPEGYLKDAVVDGSNLALTTTYEYDLAGNVTRVIDPRGNDRLFTVNQLNQVVREHSRRVTMFGGAATARYERDFFFDANDNLVQVDVQNVDDVGTIQPNSHFTTLFRYDILDFLVQKSEEVSVGSIVTRYRRDRNENLVKTRFGEATNGNQPANTLTMVYDERDLLFRLIRAKGDPDQSTEQRDYDGNGNRIRRRQGLEGRPQVTTQVFDAYNRRVSTTDPMGNDESFSFDPNGNQVSRLVMGELVDLPGNAGNVRLFEDAVQFDAMDRPTQADTEHFALLDGSPTGDGQSTRSRVFSDAGQTLWTTDDNGNVTTFSFDTAHRLQSRTDAKGNSTTFNRDANGNVTAIIEFESSDLGSTPQTFLTSQVFDEEDRLVQTLDNDDNRTSFGYDSRHNRTREVDALGNQVAHAFDGLSRKTTTLRTLTDDGTGGGNPVGQILTTEVWDDSSRRVGRGDGNGNVQQYSYDALGRIVAQTEADGTVRATTFDVHDNPVQTTDANGTVVMATFDARNRRVSSAVTPGPGVSNDTTFETFAFDGRSHLVQADDDDSTVVRRWDSLSNLIGEDQNGRTFTSRFDGEGNRWSCVYPGGQGLTATFDALNRMDWIGDSSEIARWYFFGPGRVQRRSMQAVSVTSDFTFDSVRRIVAADHIDTGPVDQRTFDWDARYNKTGMADTRPGGTGLATTFTYDSAHRLVRTLVQTAFGGPQRDTNYALDDVGNREAVTGDPVCSGDYDLDPNLPTPGDFQTNQYTDTPCDSRTYDDNGNLLLLGSAPAFTAMTYDFKNRMVSYGSDATYGYDALGRRIRKSVTDPSGVSLTSEYLYDQWQMCEERDGTGSVQKVFVYGLGIDEVVLMRDENGDTCFCADDQGSIVAALRPGAGVLCRYTYDDFGRPSFFDGAGNPLPGSATGNPYLFIGRRFDMESGFYYYRTRYLDPIIGKFTTRDTIGIWGDANNTGNGYAYVGNNPQTWVDPFGEDNDPWYAYGLPKRAHQGGISAAAYSGRSVLNAIWMEENMLFNFLIDMGLDNPKPDGSPSGLLDESLRRLIDLLKELGGSWVDEINIYATPLGMILEDSGGTLAPLVNPVPIDLGREWDGGGSGGLGLNAGGIREQMERKKRQGKGNDNDDPDDDGSGKPPDDLRKGYYWDIGPSVLVNPHDNVLRLIVAPPQVTASR